MRHARDYLRAAITISVVAGAMLGCSESTPSTPLDQSGTFFGPVTALASGTARTYVTLDGSGAPTEIGVALTESALTGLPNATAEYAFALPSQASATAFKHAVINWMPTGHPPPMVYTVPHFDVHFYTIAQATREGIVLGDSVLTAKIMRQPAPEFIPAGYAAGMAAALMGLHWNDPDAPERHGGPFTRTFIYGSYDGAMIFAEPMIAKAYLDAKPDVASVPVKLPAQYGVHGYQATSYAVGWDAVAKEYRIALTGLVLR
ncbi:MAG: DUF5602 domain-containing protein [Gemmatimonadaceae bacterium]